MKLLQLNAWAGRLEDQVEELIQSENPDIVCLQEVVNIDGGKAAFFITIDDIRKELGYDHSYYSPVYSMNFMRRRLAFGNGILSKFPIIDKDTTFTYLAENDNFDFLEDDYNVRNLQHVVIRTEDGKLNVLNHHGFHVPRHKDGDDETLRQCKQIADYIKTLNGPVILAGDFNLSPHSPSLEQINEILTNLSIMADLKTTRTDLTHKSEVCDYIFVSKDIRVKSFKASDKVVSDHMALILEF